MDWLSSIALRVPTWGPARAALLFGLLAGAAGALISRPGVRARLPQLPTRYVRFAIALLASLLSLLYVALVLRGGARIIDATSYWLEAKLLASSHFTFRPLDPSASFRGRFLLLHEGRLGGIFPPGWPLLLSFGMRMGAPFLVGALVAGALVVVTGSLARELAWLDGGRGDSTALPLLAGAFSAFCAALRYHTAEPMAHGAAALELACALACALRGRRERSPGWSLAAGASLGALIATRPISGVAPLAVCVFLTARGVARKRTGSLLLLGMVPGVVLLVASQAAVTGEPFASTQRRYYATSDGPADCFRYGFGKGVGCLFEHGDFVRSRLPSGYGFVEALGTSARRLSLHLMDVTNAEILTVAALALVLCSLRRSRAARFGVAIVLGHALAYAPFYFDANYPGGGARLWVDVLPLEHALLAVLLLRGSPEPVGRGVLAIGAMLAAFGLRGARDHEVLRDRDGGRPYFEAETLEAANVRGGVVFVEGDHAFNLAFDPRTNARDGIVFARKRGDGHDALLLRRLGDPPAYEYRFENGAPRVMLFEPKPVGLATYRFEAESDWPVLEQAGGFAIPVWHANEGASSGVVLELRSNGPRTASAVLSLPVPDAGPLRVTPHPFLLGLGGHGRLRIFEESTPLTEWSWTDAVGITPGPFELEAHEISAHGRELRLVVEGEPPGVALDETIVTTPR